MKFFLYIISISLFLLGVGILHLLGNGLFKNNSNYFAICFIVGIILILPSTLSAIIYQYVITIKKLKRNFQIKKKYENLSINGARLEIPLNENSIIVKDFTPNKNNDFELVKTLLGFDAFDVFKRKINIDYCAVTIKYTIIDMMYYK